MNIAVSGAAALVLVLTCTSVPACAMPGAGGSTETHASDPAERFRQMDTNHDEKLTWEELSAARPNLSRNAFDIIDTDHDGYIALEEWKAFSAGHGGSATMPDMSEMMKGMRGAGDRGAMTAPEGGMPLVMPPVRKDGAAAAPSNSARTGTGIPLITPPTEGK